MTQPFTLLNLSDLHFGQDRGAANVYFDQKLEGARGVSNPARYHMVYNSEKAESEDAHHLGTHGKNRQVLATSSPHSTFLA